MLDFYLIGLARTGTSALRRTVNLHKNVFCTGERFHTGFDPENVHFPKTFLDMNIPSHNPKAVHYCYEEIPTLDHKDILRIGEKPMRKHYATNLLNKVRKSFVIYRSYKQAVSSWTRRADNPEDAWPQYLRGNLFFLDGLFFFMLQNYISNAVYISYDEMYFGDYKHELGLFCNGLEIPFDAFDEEGFIESVYDRRDIKAKRRETTPEERYVAANIGLVEFEVNYFNADSYTSRKKAIKMYSSHVANNFAQYLDTVLQSLSPSQWRFALHICENAHNHIEDSAFQVIREQTRAAKSGSLSYLFLSYIVAQRKGDLNRSVALLDEILNAVPGCHPVCTRLSQVFHSVGDISMAQRLCDKAKEIENSSIDPWVRA